MARIPTDTPIPEALGDVFAAASNNRRPPLNLHRQMVDGPAVLVPRSAVANRGGVPEAIFQEALEAGYSSAQLADVFVSIQLASFVNHFVNDAETPFDVPTAAEAA
jgi:alkylhydroperoxidase family enzyme